jgi:vacuolar protein sorting-associated protein 13A/C
VSEIRFNVSFNPVVSSDVSIASEAAPLLIGALNRVLLAIGSSVAKIDNCPLRFKALVLEHVFASSKGFTDVMFATYAVQAMKQAYLLVLSSELLGNPIQLFQSISEGLWDFMYLPTIGLLTSPEDFVLGVLRGSSSLVRNVVASVCATAGHLMNSLQVGLLALGAVDSYPAIESDQMPLIGEANSLSSLVNESAKRRSQRPSSSLEAFSMALTGVVMDPIVGFQSDGLRGLIIGSAKGSVGLFARPLYGLLGAGSLTMEQASFRLLPRFLANQKLRLMRARPPRYFLSPHVPLQVYSADENLALEILARLEQGAFRHEECQWHTKLSSNRIVLLTKIRIMILEDNFEYTSIVWQCPIKHILSIEVDCANSKCAQDEDNMQTMSTALRVLEAPEKKIKEVYPKRRTSLAHKGFNSKLIGQPIFHLYHLPQSDRSHR